MRQTDDDMVCMRCGSFVRLNYPSYESLAARCDCRDHAIGINSGDFPSWWKPFRELSSSRWYYLDGGDFNPETGKHEGGVIKCYNCQEEPTVEESESSVEGKDIRLDISCDCSEYGRKDTVHYVESEWRELPDI